MEYLVIWFTDKLQFYVTDAGVNHYNPPLLQKRDNFFNSYLVSEYHVFMHPPISFLNLLIF